MVDQEVDFQAMFLVYVIENRDRELYIGFTNNLERRIEEHNSGKNISTKDGIPWKLVYYEACINQKDAIRREKYLKSSQGSRLIRARIKEYLYSCRS